MARPDPLKMAENCVAAVERIARWQSDPDPDVQLQAVILGAGKTGMDSATVGACMALVSIARDLRRLVDRLEWDRL
jgi:hypothetical protein